MKTFLISLLACGIALAQAHSSKSATARREKSRSGSAPDLLDPNTLKARAPEVYKVKIDHHQG